MEFKAIRVKKLSSCYDRISDSGSLTKPATPVSSVSSVSANPTSGVLPHTEMLHIQYLCAELKLRLREQGAALVPA